MVSELRTPVAFFCAFLGSMLLVATVMACQVPVFRYALERWESDPYELVCVPGKGGLQPPEEAVLENLRKALADHDFPANITVRVADQEDPNNHPARFDLFYPRVMQEHLDRPIWSGEVTEENSKNFCNRLYG